MKKIIGISLLSLTGGFLGAWIFTGTAGTKSFPDTFAGEQAPVHSVAYRAEALGDIDFIKASKTSTPCVVFIKTISAVQQNSFWDDWFSNDMFGNRGKVSSSGSGVIISDDGYIVTNNHVVEGAEDIEVILNNNRHSFKAKVIGTDPSTDLALLKIDAKKLPKLIFGNSDNVEIGEWVIAVGNPFNLTSTVTAGIVSAKGRNINVVNNSFPIESFIQTDAAINPGNSGGALVNLRGELVGINTAIASQTGAYNGYGFAIPANIVGKIVKDLIEYGEVQRAFTGMEVIDINATLAEKLGGEEKGVYVNFVTKEGPAAKAGIKEGDVILKVNGREVNSKSYFDEQVAYQRPGDKMTVETAQGKNSRQSDLTLVNREGTTATLKRTFVASSILGADFEAISKVEKDRYGISSGIRVGNIRNGQIRKMNIPEGFIFVSLNKTEYNNAKEFVRDLEQVRGRIMIDGISPSGTRQYLSFYYY